MNVELVRALESLQAMTNSFIARLPVLGVALVVFALFAFGAAMVRRLIQTLVSRRRRHYNLGLALGRLVQGGIVLLGLLVGLVIAIPTFKPGQLVQLLGIGSVAIGFAFRDILQNFLAGILLLLTEPFRVGDQIVVGAFEGTVEDIQTRATFIRTYDGRRVVIPNGALFTDSVIVNTAYAARRLEYDIGIGYGDDVERARELALEAVRGVDGVLSDPAPDVLVVDLAPSSVNLRVRWWIEPPRRADALASRDRVLAEVKRTLTAHGIDLPFPTQQVLFHDQTEISDGDRGRQREGWPANREGNPRPLGIARMLRARRADGRDGQPGPP